MASELEHVQKALRELDKSLKNLSGNPPPERVHKLRTAARRVEAIATALPLHEEKESRKLVESIEPLRKAAGGVRDMDVLSSKIRRLTHPSSNGSSAHSSALARLVDHFESARAEEAAELVHRLDGHRKKAQHNLRRFTRDVESAFTSNGHGTNGHTPRRRPVSRVAPSARKLCRTLEEWPPLNAENIHSFRLKLKRLRYILQLDEKADAGFVEALGKVQRHIGDWHDWEQLAEIAREFLDPAQEQKSLEKIDATADEKLRRAISEAKALRRRYLRMGMRRVLGC